MSENVAEHSVRTITQALEKYMALDFDGLTLEAVREVPGKRSTGGSQVQAYLEGLEFDVDGKWYSGHITLSPSDDKRHDVYFSSAHLTITGAGPYRGNWFFSVDEGGAEPSAPPKKFKGQSSRDGNELPAQLKTDVAKLLDLIGTFA